MPAVAPARTTISQESLRSPLVSGVEWAQLVESAVAAAPCATDDCHIAIWLRFNYIEIQHVDPAPHLCSICSEFMPSHVCSAAYLGLHGAELVRRQLVAWLSHLHAPSNE